jgi:hypothetical protein
MEHLPARYGFSESSRMERSWRAIMPADRPHAVVALNDLWQMV